MTTSSRSDTDGMCNSKKGILIVRVRRGRFAAGVTTRASALGIPAWRRRDLVIRTRVGCTLVV